MIRNRSPTRLSPLTKICVTTLVNDIFHLVLGHSARLLEINNFCASFIEFMFDSSASNVLLCTTATRDVAPTSHVTGGTHFSQWNDAKEYWIYNLNFIIIITSSPRLTVPLPGKLSLSIKNSMMKSNYKIFTWERLKSKINLIIITDKQPITSKARSEIWARVTEDILC